VVVAFVDEATVWVLLIGPHVSNEPQRNIYDVLYSVIGETPATLSGRMKPPCCDETNGEAPLWDVSHLERLLQDVTGTRQ
jgi:hypothetical protein